MSGFRKATVKNRKFRAAIMGTAGSGKSLTSLILASTLGKRIALIDTEHGSAEMYANTFEFDTLNLTEYHPQKYIDAVKEAAKEGYEVVVIDSLSHAWSGKGGALELVDQATARNKGSSFGAWRDVTPLQNQLVDAIIGCPAHVICTLRSKTDYQVETEGGKTRVRKVGLAPVQRDGMEYEFDFLAEMDADHRMIVTKSRIPALADKVVTKPDAKFFLEFQNYLNQGVAVEMAAEIKNTMDAVEMATEGQILKLVEAAKSLGGDWLAKVMNFYKIKSFEELTKAQADTVLARAESNLVAK